MIERKDGPTTWQYLYTASGERVVEKNAATGLERWTLRGPDNQVLRTMERQPNGQWSVLRDNLFAGRRLLAAHSPAGLHHFHLDHLGSVRLETDAAGNPIKYRDFLPFGESLDTPGGTENRLLYTGHQRDDMATPTTTDDLDYMHARYCSPTFGRFLSVDPVLGRTASPQSWNRYAYVRGNPVKLVDPYGREPITIGVLLLGAIEVGFTGYDVYDTYTTVTDPQESGFNKLLSGGGLAAGIILPGGAYGKAAKVLMARAEKVPGVARVVRASTDAASRVLGFSRGQLQHAFRHAADFGVGGNANNKTLAQFQEAIQAHVDSGGTRAIQGTYRGAPVTHYVDPETGLNVIQDSSGDFLSGWKLSAEQLEHVLSTGKLGGG